MLESPRFDDAVPVRWRGAGGLPASAPAPAPAPAPDGWGSGVPVASRRLVADFSEADDPVVIGIQGPDEREAARLAIRAAIVAELAAMSGLPPQRIALHGAPGDVPFALLDAPGGQRRAWLAISHDGALSVAAISLRGAVGIDVQRILDIPDWQPLARDYLGPDLAVLLAALPAPERPRALARAWSEREARLKYFGRELVEWSAEDERALGACRCLPLLLPEGYAGALTLA